jgi:hypothetical protein
LGCCFQEVPVDGESIPGRSREISKGFFEIVLKRQWVHLKALKEF